MLYVINEYSYIKLDKGHQKLIVPGNEYYIVDYVLRDGTRPVTIPGETGTHLMNYLNDNGFRHMTDDEIAKYLLL